MNAHKGLNKVLLPLVGLVGPEVLEGQEGPVRLIILEDLLVQVFLLVQCVLELQVSLYQVALVVLVVLSLLSAQEDPVALLDHLDQQSLVFQWGLGYLSLHETRFPLSILVVPVVQVVLFHLSPLESQVDQEVHLDLAFQYLASLEVLGHRGALENLAILVHLGILVCLGLLELLEDHLSRVLRCLVDLQGLVAQVALVAPLSLAIQLHLFLAFPLALQDLAILAFLSVLALLLALVFLAILVYLASPVQAFQKDLVVLVVLVVPLALVLLLVPCHLCDLAIPSLLVYLAFLAFQASQHLESLVDLADLVFRLVLEDHDLVFLAGQVVQLVLLHQALLMDPFHLSLHLE
eukprot:g43484.t1